MELKSMLRIVKMFLKPVWVGKIHGVGVYATHSPSQSAPTILVLKNRVGLRT